VENRTLVPFFIHPFGHKSHFKDSMDMTTRDAVSVVGTTIHEDFLRTMAISQPRIFEPMFTTRHHTTSHLAVDSTTPKLHQKRKEKPRLGISYSNKSCRYTKTSCTDFYYTSLHPSKAHRICSVKMVLGKDFWKYFTTILITCSCLLCLALTVVQSWHALAG